MDRRTMRRIRKRYRVLLLSAIVGALVVPVGYGHPPRHHGYYGRQGYYGAGYYWGGSYRGGYYRRG